ncbi:MAG: phosphatidylserine decarboxylase [Pyrinomonadaceae bacterium]
MIAREGIPFIVVPLALAIILAVGVSWIAGLVVLLLAAFMVYFFRDPERAVPGEDDIVVSAADGVVTRVDESPEAKLVSVFLSPLDVHVNRAPIAGRVVAVDYIRGKKVPATSDQASLVNERNSVTIEGERMTVTVTQIAGILARRIVCRCRVGDHLALGERFGLIKFSSRTDLLMPANVELLVKTGDRVVGGETIIARLRP